MDEQIDAECGPIAIEMSPDEVEKLNQAFITPELRAQGYSFSPFRFLYPEGRTSLALTHLKLIEMGRLELQKPNTTIGPLIIPKHTQADFCTEVLYAATGSTEIQQASILFSRPDYRAQACEEGTMKAIK